jgi:hypothetical protein
MIRSPETRPARRSDVQKMVGAAGENLSGWPSFHHESITCLVILRWCSKVTTAEVWPFEVPSGYVALGG